MSGTITYPPLTPIMSEWVSSLIQRPDMLRALIRTKGSPVNILNPDSFVKNYRKFNLQLTAMSLRHQVFFARKANKDSCFIEAARDLGFGVDTASYRELQQSLDLGCPPHQLVVTAAVKNERLLRLAIRNNVLLILDNPDEVRLADSIARSEKRKVRAGLRLQGFKAGGHTLHTRFGFPVDQAGEFILRNLNASGKYGLAFEGLHFHLDGYSITERSAALKTCIELADSLKENGIATRFIDIGGGILINYLKDHGQWECFKTTLQEAIRGNHPPITYRNNGLGYSMNDHHEITGALATYPFYNTLNGPLYLKNVLEAPFNANITLAEALNHREIELRLEPGRSLLDQAGITVARVAYRKKDTDGTPLVGLEMNMSQLRSSSADFLLDPVMICGTERPSRPIAVNFTGEYCLERDLILQRKILLDHLPDVGDLVVFINTAGYMMHFFESQAHLFDLAANVTLPEIERRLADQFHLQKES